MSGNPIPLEKSDENVVTKPKKTVLILDDEEGTRNILERMIYRAGYNVVVAATGKQALQQVAANRGSISLILSDIRTPLMNGIEFMREVRRLNLNTPAIFISGAPNRTQVDQLKTMGVTNIFLKPIKTTILIEKIKELIGEDEQAGGTT